MTLPCVATLDEDGQHTIDAVARALGAIHTICSASMLALIKISSN